MSQVTIGDLHQLFGNAITIDPLQSDRPLGRRVGGIDLSVELTPDQARAALLGSRRPG